MLLQNPQLAYALLQAQVVMRIIDPQTASVRLKTTFLPKHFLISTIIEHVASTKSCAFYTDAK